MTGVNRASRARPARNEGEPLRANGDRPETRKCYICEKVGHIAKDCRAKQKKKKATVAKARVETPNEADSDCDAIEKQLRTEESDEDDADDPGKE